MQMQVVSYFHGDNTTVSQYKSFSVSGSGFLFIIGPTDFSRYRALGRTGLTLSLLFSYRKQLFSILLLKNKIIKCERCVGEKDTPK